MCGRERCERRTLISLENCRRMPPAFFPVDPDPRRSRSSTRTSRTPFFVRWYAIEAPMIPPPTMTTSAVRRTMRWYSVDQGQVDLRCRRGELNPQALAGGSPWSCCVYRFTTSAGRNNSIKSPARRGPHVPVLDVPKTLAGIGERRDPQTLHLAALRVEVVAEVQVHHRHLVRDRLKYRRVQLTARRLIERAPRGLEVPIDRQR